MVEVEKMVNVGCIVVEMIVMFHDYIWFGVLIGEFDELVEEYIEF